MDNVFSNKDYSVRRLVDEISTGDLGLPDIQRPFVWKSAKVRDLFDSMYRGFPVGYLLFWENEGDPQANTRGIGVDGKQSVPRRLIVDGQQRLTSLYAVMTGTPVVDADYREKPIRIAFHPGR